MGPGGRETLPRHPKRERQGKLREEPAAPSLRASRSRRSPAPGAARGRRRRRRRVACAPAPLGAKSAIPRLWPERTPSSARRTISGTRPKTALSGVYAQAAARACAHTFPPPRAAPTPRAQCLRRAGSASPGWSERVLRGVFKAAVPAPPCSPPSPARPPRCRLGSSRPPLEPGCRACAARGAGAGEPLACRCPAGGGSGAGRAPRAPPPGSTRALARAGTCRWRRAAARRPVGPAAAAARGFSSRVPGAAPAARARAVAPPGRTRRRWPRRPRRGRFSSSSSSDATSREK